MNEEEAFLRGFVVAAKQERDMGLLSSPKRRKKATAALDHRGGGVGSRRVPGRRHDVLERRSPCVGSVSA
jgi:hypothetical protein